MRGAGDTVRSIIISANSRLAFLENKQVLRLLSKDELNLSDIGIGVNGDGETKTALFCVIPDSDKSYNFIIGMLYTQIFQELYYQADFNCGGRLPKLKQKFYFYQDMSKDDDVPKKLQNDFLHQMYEDFGTIEEDCFYDRLEDGKYDEGFKERQVKEEKSR